MVATATGFQPAKMKWTKTDNGMPKISFLHRVVLESWPDHIVFDAPRRNSSLNELNELIDRFRSGETRFRRMTNGEIIELSKGEGVHPLTFVREAARVDTGRRPVRREETRSKVLRKYDVKSTRLVGAIEDWMVAESEDPIEEDWTTRVDEDPIKDWD